MRWMLVDVHFFMECVTAFLIQSQLFKEPVFWQGYVNIITKPGQNNPDELILYSNQEKTLKQVTVWKHAQQGLQKINRKTRKHFNTE